MKKVIILILVVIFIGCSSYYLTSQAPKQMPQESTNTTKHPISQQYLDTESSQQKQTAQSSLPLNNNSASLEIHNKQKETDNKNESKVTQIVSFDSLVSSDGHKDYLNSDPIESLTVNEVRSLISELTLNLTTNHAADIKERFSAIAIELEQSNQSLRIEDVQCSDQLCGFMFQAEHHDLIDSTLDALTRNQQLKTTWKGGTMRIIEDNGSYYGLLIASISDKPLVIK